MGTEKMSLDEFISKLMSDDNTLKAFLDDSTNGGCEFGITKAERAVIRRVVKHLPTTSKNGFSLSRTMSSHRRSLRLLQNVLHHNASKMHSNVLKSTSDVESNAKLGAGSQNGGAFHLYVYYPNGGSQDYTCKQNSAVDANGGPYANYRQFQIVFGSGATTVERLLLGASQAFPNNISYQTVNGTNNDPYVSEINIDGNSIAADLSQSCYDPSKDDNVFWFYSINGTPNHGGVHGIEAMSFANYPLNDGDTVYWQLIAPDKQYGFAPCH